MNPQSIIIRPALVSDAAAICYVRMRSWQSSYRGIIADAYLDAMDPEEFMEYRLKSIHSNKQINLVAEAGGIVVGWITAGKNSVDCEYGSEVYAVYLLEKFKKRGIGKRLMQEAARLLLEMGYSSMMLWVLTDNPSRYFYEKMGGKFHSRKQIKIAAQTLDEDAFVWSDLNHPRLRRQ